MFLLFERFPIQRRGPDVDEELMEARLLSDAWQQQEKAHRAKTFEKGCCSFCLKSKISVLGKRGAGVRDLLIIIETNLNELSGVDYFIHGFSPIFALTSLLSSWHERHYLF
jgi:hypothetical protein